MRHVKFLEKKWSIAGSCAKNVNTRSEFRAKIRGTDARRNPQTGAMRPQRGMDMANDVYNLKKNEKDAFGSPAGAWVFRHPLRMNQKSENS